MTRPICVQCGTQYPDLDPDLAAPPATCPVCTDERQYVRWDGQAWTDLQALRRDFRNRVADEFGLTGIGMTPHFAIGQRALLVPAGDGVVLWDCVSLLSEETVSLIRARGGLRAIAISHPHYYTTIGEWSDAFGGVPIYLHADDAPHIRRDHPAIRLWSGERQDIGHGITLIRCGGHYPGGTVLHHAHGAGGRGALLAGDILQVARDRRHVGFMYSYPNWIPLGPAAIRRIASALAPFAFEQVFGAFADLVIATEGRQAVDRSIIRYLAAIAPEDS